MPPDGELFAASERISCPPPSIDWALVPICNASERHSVGRAIEQTHLIYGTRGVTSLEPRKPLGAIVVECFPLFYESVPLAKQTSRLLDPFSLLEEPDRRKDVRNELISHFLASDWDPVDLALTARRSGIIKKTAERLVRTGQRAYLGKMINRLKARGQNDLALDLWDAARTAKR